jgi:hypothetical protein
MDCAAQPLGSERAQYHASRSQSEARDAGVPCAKSVPESDVFMPLGLALSEKQIPQNAENTRSESS